MKIPNRSGQSLVELIVAIAVIEVGIFAVWSLFLVNFNAEREAEMRIVGVNLAREGVEVIKNIRDSNWIKNSNNEETAGKIWSWDQNLANGDYVVDYDSDQPIELSEGNDQLYVAPNGFYTHVAEDNVITPFKRQVLLKDICCLDSDENLKCDGNDYAVLNDAGTCSLKIGINIVSKATWIISGGSRQAVVEDNIYNWK